jgi:hypothetical protein
MNCHLSIPPEIYSDLIPPNDLSDVGWESCGKLDHNNADVVEAQMVKLGEQEADGKHRRKPNMRYANF